MERSTAVHALALGALLSLALPARGQCWGPAQGFAAPDGVDLDEFGAVLDVEGSTLVVGGPQDSTFGEDGAAYVYDRDRNGSWLFSTKLVDFTAEGTGNHFGRACALDGDTVVVASGPDFQVFERSAGVWSLTTAVQTSLSLSGAAALDGDTLAVASVWSFVLPFVNIDGVLVHERDQGGPDAWGEVLMIPPSQAGDPRVGANMALEGDTLVVSEHWWDGPGLNNQGRVRVFSRDQGGPGAWGEVQFLEPTGNGFNAWFGAALALEGDTLVVAAPRQAQGRLYVYDRIPAGTGTWVEVERFTPPHTDVGYWPSAVVVSGNTLAAIDEKPISTFTGAVFHYSRDVLGGWHYVERQDIPPQGVASLRAWAVETDGQQTFVGYDGGITVPGAVQTFADDSPAVPYCTPGTSSTGCAAYIRACGTPSASASSGFTLSAVDVECCGSGLFFYGTGGRQAAPWGNGTSLQCVVPPVQRGGLLGPPPSAPGCGGAFQEDLNARWCPTCPKPSHNPGAGAVTQAQFWYRDPLNTSNQPTGLSAAVEFVVGP